MKFRTFSDSETALPGRHLRDRAASSKPECTLAMAMDMEMLDSVGFNTWNILVHGYTW
jgi:hypothetical protein